MRNKLTCDDSAELAELCGNDAELAELCDDLADDLAELAELCLPSSSRGDRLPLAFKSHAAATDDSVLEPGRPDVDPVAIASASSEANLEYEDTTSVVDLDFECTADVCLEPDLSD